MEHRGEAMKRRDFLGVLGGAVAAWPLAARAQESPRVYRIALISPAVPTSAFGGQPLFQAFFKELRRLGYDEGRNLAVVRYSGGGRAEHYAELAQEVVRAKPDVIVTASSGMVVAFKAASSTIPIVGYHWRSGRLWHRRKLGPTGRQLYRSQCIRTRNPSENA